MLSFPGIAADAIHAETARDLWLDLEERFSQVNVPRIFELQQKIIFILQGQDSVTIYYSMLKGLWDELNVYSPIHHCTCDPNKTLEGYRDRDRSMQFLMGLNESYTTVRGPILLMNPIPTVSEVFSLLLQEERQRGMAVSRPTMEFAALAAKESDNGGKNRRQNYSNNSKTSCDFCGRMGHFMDKCVAQF